MFGLSFSELFVIGIVALIVIGPERLPKVARTVGHLVGRAQRYVTDIKSDIQREMDIQDLTKLKDDIQSSANEMKSSFEKNVASIKDPFDGIKQDLGDTGKQLKQELNALPDLADLQKPASASQAAAPVVTQQAVQQEQAVANLESLAASHAKSDIRIGAQAPSPVSSPTPEPVSVASTDSTAATASDNKVVS